MKGFMAIFAPAESLPSPATLQEVHYLMVLVYIKCYTVYILQATTRKNEEFVSKRANTRQMKILWPFLRSPKSCQLLLPWFCVLQTCNVNLYEYECMKKCEILFVQ